MSGCPGAAAPAGRCVAGSSSTRTVLRHLLLRVRHPLLSRASAVRPRRPDADATRAGAVRVLARLGARAVAATADRHRRRPGAAAAARLHLAHAVHRRAVRPGRDSGRSAPPPLGRERLAQRLGEQAATPRPLHSSGRNSRGSDAVNHRTSIRALEPEARLGERRRRAPRVIARRSPVASRGVPPCLACGLVLHLAADDSVLEARPRTAGETSPSASRRPPATSRAAALRR